MIIDATLALSMALGALQTPPQPITPTRPWTTDDDYPEQARKNGEQGAVEFTLRVAASGKVIACRITRGSGSEALDGATCPIMSRAMRFKPARDPSGKRVEGEFASRFNWKLPTP